MYRIFFGCCLIVLLSCENKMTDVNKLLSEEVPLDEIAHDVLINYSDSAQLKVKAWGPTMRIDREGKETREEFPDGLHVEFYNQRQQVESWLDSKYAIREYTNNIIIARDSVILYNKSNDKLETSELIWDEKKQLIYTDKFVRITQPEKGDTVFGYGFETDQEFKEFKISNFSGKMTVDEIDQALSGNENDSEPIRKRKRLQ